MRFSLLAWAALCVALACGGRSSNYAAAGVGLGSLVTLSAVNRAVTGDCWAVCSPGFACDRPRGTCVRAECIPECAVGEHCVIEQDDRFRCMDDLGTARLGARARPLLGDAGSAQDAASPVAASSAASDAAADAAGD